MSFTSWQYAIMLPVVFLLYWPLPWRGRIWLLLLASYFFYGFWDARFLALLLSSTTVDFFCGLAMAGRRESPVRVAATAAAPLAWLGFYRLALQKTAALDHWIFIAAAVFPFFSARCTLCSGACRPPGNAGPS
jgi:D-alanyl-lipoteichoic acid acyltransferase DltB (MBOAT superfamily)